MKPSVLVIFLIFSLFQKGSGQSAIKRLDTHIHLYDTNRLGSFDFLDDHKTSGSNKLYFPHLAQQFSDSANTAGVRFAYVVEASTRREDNFWLSEICDTSACILGFSANLDPLSATFVSDLDSLSKNPKFRGIRPRIDGFKLSDSETIKQLGELEKRNLVLELWGNSAAIARVALEYPNMNIIINHFAGGAVGDDSIPNESVYKSKLAVLAVHKNVFIKISALYTLSGKNPAPTNFEYYKPLIDAAVDAFSPERVMFGSNWPLSGLRGNYKDMITLLEDYCSQRDDLSSEQLFYSNAINAYGLNKSITFIPTKSSSKSQYIFPNPASEKVNVKTGKPSSVEIFSANGNKVFDCHMAKDTHVIQINNFDAGIYLVRSINQENVRTQKLIIL